MHVINDVVEQSKLRPEQHLRNRCRQLEQQYVEWQHKATHDGFLLVQEWPQIGELSRYTTVTPPVVLFRTTRRRSIEVLTADRRVLGEVKMQTGMAEQLYVIAGEQLDKSVFTIPDASLQI